MSEPITLQGVLTGFDKAPLGGVRVVAEPRRKVVAHDTGVAVATTRSVTAKVDDPDPTGSFNMPLVWDEGLSYRVYAEPDGVLRELGILDCTAHAPGSAIDVKILPPATAPADEAADAAWRAWVREQLALLDPATLEQFIEDYLTDNPPSGGVTTHGDLDGRDATDQHPIGAVTGLQDALDDKADTGHNHDGTYATAAQGAKADTAVQPAQLAAETQARIDADTALAADIATRQTAAQVDARVQLLIGAAPAALDTFEEIAARLADDADAVAALTTLVATKVPETRTVNGKALNADITLSPADVEAATAAQGAKADSAVQPADLPTFGSAAEADTADFASAAQGAKADTALQAADLAAHVSSDAHDARYVTVVEHGTDPDVARPAGATVVLWVGSVEPNNAAAGDQWDDASGSPSNYIEEPASDGTNGQVLTTDGAGGRSWTTVAGGGGSDPWTYVVATVDTDSGTAGATVDITGLSFTGLADGLYEFRAIIIGQALSTGAGVQTGISVPTGLTVNVQAVGPNASNANIAQGWLKTAANLTNGTFSFDSLNAISNSMPYIATTYTGTMRAASMGAGVFKMTIKSELSGAGTNAYAKADSFIAYRRIAD